MGDEQSGDRGKTDPSGGGRRGADRRQAEVPFAGPDRRRGDRRSGQDRRTSPRSDGGADDTA